MKTINLIFVSLAFINCYGSNDSGVNTAPTAAASNAQLIFDGRSYSYTLIYGGNEIADAKLSFTQQEEVNPMELKSLPVDHATEFSTSVYFPKFQVTAESQGLSCQASSIAFSDSMMKLVCQERAEATPDTPPSGTSEPVAKPAVAQPAVNPPASPTTPPSNSATTCNESQLQICLEYQGGDACYPRWGCVK